jgi:DNA-binding NarL/FixJ family response regulator
MTVVPHPQAPTSVLVIDPEPSVRNAIARLLSLDETLQVIGTAPSLSTAAENEADIVVDETLLQEFKNLSVAEFVAMVRNLPVSPLKQRRHLRPVGGRREILAALSDREVEVVKLVAEGLSNKQISLRLKLSDKTVKNHISHILAKLNLSARTQVAVHAIRTGLV